jgi:hypothetical protein
LLHYRANVDTVMHVTTTGYLNDKCLSDMWLRKRRTFIEKVRCDSTVSSVTTWFFCGAHNLTFESFIKQEMKVTPAVLEMTSFRGWQKNKKGKLNHFAKNSNQHFSWFASLRMLF